MSTLPFLLSVADELDNINSQSYLDDFGLGFHPHRQYYRTPTIQLSLPAGTEWMEERQRYRPHHKYYDESLNNVSEENAARADDDEDAAAAAAAADDDRTGNGGGASTSAAAAAGGRHKYASALNSNVLAQREGGAAGDDDNIDNSVQLYNLSKKCCKNYYRHHPDHHAHSHSHGHGHSHGAKDKEKSSGGGYRLHPKCMEGNHSSSEESLQKVSSSIEFLTCFLLKKSRPSSKHAGDGGSKKS